MSKQPKNSFCKAFLKAWAYDLGILIRVFFQRSGPLNNLNKSSSQLFVFILQDEGAAPDDMEVNMDVEMEVDEPEPPVLQPPPPPPPPKDPSAVSRV